MKIRYDILRRREIPLTPNAFGYLQWSRECPSGVRRWSIRNSEKPFTNILCSTAEMKKRKVKRSLGTALVGPVRTGRVQSICVVYHARFTALLFSISTCLFINNISSSTLGPVFLTHSSSILFYPRSLTCSSTYSVPYENGRKRMGLHIAVCRRRARSRCCSSH